MVDIDNSAPYHALHGNEPELVNGKWRPSMSQTAQAFQQAAPAARTIHIVLHEAKDTVGVAVVEGITAGTQLNAWIMDEDEIITVSARQEIPIGHKVALKDMAVGDTVYKYGVDIGKVVAPIKAGEHAHVHNIKTKRW